MKDVLRAIKRELHAIIITLQQIYEGTGDAEAYCLLLASQVGVASIVFQQIYEGY